MVLSLEYFAFEQITNTEGVITLRNKPLGNYMEAVGIPEITDELLSSVQRDGTLSEQGINSIRGGPGAKGDPALWGMLYERATGHFFRKYFVNFSKKSEFFS